MGSDISLPSDAIGIYSCSDLHTDWDENMDMLRKHVEVSTRREDRVLLVCGDISADLGIWEKTIVLLKKAYYRIFFTFGNNELRIKRGEIFQDSMEKYELICKLCDKLGVEMSPGLVRDHWIVPLHCWYQADFEPSWDGHLTYQKGWLDFRECKFKNYEYDKVGDYFLALNQKLMDPILLQDDRKVISFSHFLPRMELLPFYSKMIRPSLSLVVGHVGLESQIRKLKSTIHVYGHSHIDGDCEIKGVRYVQHALAHPRERDHTFKGDYHPKLIQIIKK